MLRLFDLTEIIDCNIWGLGNYATKIKVFKFVAKNQILWKKV